MNKPPTLIAFTMMLVLSIPAIGAETSTSSDWTSGAPRPDISTAFVRLPTGGRDGGETLIISADARSEAQGYWIRSYPAVGGTWIQFRAYCRMQQIPTPRRSVFARLLWAGANTTAVRPPVNAVKRYEASVLPENVELYGSNPNTGIGAMDEFPAVMATGVDGWSEVTGIYLAPRDTNRVTVELNLQFAPGGRVEWSSVSIETVVAPPRRTVKVAAVNFEPSGGHEPLDNCRMAEPFIAEAAQRGAQLVVLSEHFTIQNLPSTWSDQPHVASAEAIPGGPISAFFGNLAKQHHLYIVVGMYERDGLSIYNDAVLFSPAGEVAGKYRKVAPTMPEMAKGIRPGVEYPVFDTPFGRVGMMVCWDTHFPETARELAKHGAEIIAVPAYGFQTLLVQARAVENQVHIITSIYEDDGKSDPLTRWGISGIIDPEGKVVARAPSPHSVAVAEIDLSHRYWVWLGNLHDRLPANIPITNAEARYVTPKNP